MYNWQYKCGSGLGAEVLSTITQTQLCYQHGGVDVWTHRGWKFWYTVKYSRWLLMTMPDATHVLEVLFCRAFVGFFVCVIETLLIPYEGYIG